MDSATASDPSSSSSNHLPWLWVIEAFADIKQVDTALLNDLVTRVSKITDESWEEIAKETLALKQLEGLLSGVNSRKALPVSGFHNHPKFEINVSDRAQDVLHRLLQLMEMPDIRVSLMELIEALRGDVAKFIQHKRASLHKCDLQQLKNAILRGADPPTKHVLFNRIPVDGNDMNASTYVDDHPTPAVSRQISGFDKRNGQFTKVCNVNDYPGATAKKLDKSTSDVETTRSFDGNMAHRGLENGNQIMKEDFCGNENSARKDSCENQLEKGTQSHGLLEDRISSGHGDAYESVSQKKLERGIGGVDEVTHNWSESPISDNQEAHRDEEHKNNLDEVEDDIEPLRKPGLSGSNNEDIDKGPSSDSEEDKGPSSDSEEDMAIAAEKHSFLSSQTFNPDKQMSSEWTEQGICMKCNEGGQLLICRNSSCPIAVHESCLGSSASFSDSGNFFCPFCSYAQAVIKYRETKKKAASIDKKATLAKNQLVQFMRIVDAQKQTQPPDTALMRQKEGIGNHIDNLQQYRGVPTPPLSKRNVIPRGKGEDQVEQVDNHKRKRVVEDQECAEPSIICRNDHVPQCTKEITLNCENIQNDPSCNEKDNMEMGEEHHSVFAQSNNRESPRRDEEIGAVHEEHADLEKENENLEQNLDSHQQTSSKENEDLEQNLNSHQQTSSKDNLNSNGTAENHNVGVSSNSCSRRLRYTTQRSNRTLSSSQTSPCRRKKIAWTSEEEEMLKEGFWKFTTSNGERIPWQQILEFGSHVFQKSRTTIDLKDKWRNIWSKGGGRRVEETTPIDETMSK